MLANNEISISSSNSNFNTDLASMRSNQLTQHDLNQQENMRSILISLGQTMHFCEKLVTAAYSLANYVPPITNDEQKQIWMQNIVPNLTKSLVQDINARAVIVRSLSSVRDLVTTIKDAADLVKSSDGLPEVLEVVKETIPEALQVVERCIVEAKGLENAAVEIFKNQTSQLFNIAGPQWAGFVQEKAKLLSQMNELQEKHEALNRELAHRNAEVERYSQLVFFTEKQIHGNEASLEAIKKRTTELKDLNEAIENKIQDIQPHLETVSTMTWGPKKWGLFASHSETTNQVDNPNKYADTDYYETIIASREKRIQERENAETAKGKVLIELNNDLAELKAKYEEAQMMVRNALNEYKDKVDRITEQMAEVKQKLQNINEKESSLVKQMGLHGDDLLQCLVQVRVFTETLHGSASIYSPIVSFLEAIRSNVLMDVKLLSTGKQSSVSLAGNRLTNRVGMLSDYCCIGNQCVKATSSEYLTVQASPHLKAIQ